MLYYRLLEETDEKLVYEYYSEIYKKEQIGNKKPGIITLDRITGECEQTQAAENDEAYYLEEFGEWHSFYYPHAKRRILDDFNNKIVKK